MDDSLAIRIHIIRYSKYVFGWNSIFWLGSLLSLIEKILSAKLVLQLSLAQHLLVLILRVYSDFIGFIRDCFLHVVDEHMLFLIKIFLFVNIICEIMRFVKHSIFCNIWLSTWWSILFLFDLKHAGISGWFILFERNALRDLLMVHFKMIEISTKYFWCLIPIPWIICLTVYWTYII